MPKSSANQNHFDTKVSTAMLSEIVGESGRPYLVERTLQRKELKSERFSRTFSVLLAKSGGGRFVLKEIPKENWDARLEVYQRFKSSPFLRELFDTVPQSSIFVFKYLNDNLLSLAQKNLPIKITKELLRRALCGLAALHAEDIVHNDVKANNILLETIEDGGEHLVQQVQLADLEEAVHLPANSTLQGIQLGNPMWCSPEAHACGPIGKYSDMFSFGIVCVYAVTKRVIFAVADEELAEGEEKLAHILERQLSYFADADGLNSFYEHLGKSPWPQVFEVLWKDFNESNPRTPFRLWKMDNVDDDFKDLVLGLTNFDPAKRLTAKEALNHRWFTGA